MKAGETTVLKLLQGSKVFLIPNFQRRYSWRAKEWELLWSDLVREMEVTHHGDSQELEGHFLGSIVLHPAAGPASILMRHLVIDGQQRLTTILVLLAALRDVRADVEDNWNPSEYDSKYLTNPYDPEHPDRLVPTELDRHAYTETLRQRNPTEGIGQAYHFFEKKIRALVRDGNVRLADVGNTLLLHMLLVEINTGSGDSVNNIFNTLNSKGRPLTSADLVRNEMLLHVGEENGRFAYDEYWTPIERSLVIEKKDGFDDREFVTFLWSREVAHDPKCTRQELFATFERRLRRELDPLDRSGKQERALLMFEEIHRDHLLFLTLRNPLEEVQGGPIVGEDLRLSLDRLRRWGSEPSTPLALWLLGAAVQGRVLESEAVTAIDMLLGYLGRRALAGVPTNLLNRILTPVASRLQNRPKDKPVVEELRDILSAQGSYWPPNAEVLGAVAHQPVFVSAKRQIKFILTEVERAISGQVHVDAGQLVVEHLMPQTLTDEWEDYFANEGVDVDDARALLHTIGNLTLAKPNSVPSSAPFDVKRAAFLDSGLELNKQLQNMPRLDLQSLQQRSVAFAHVILDLLPGPAARQDSRASKAQAGGDPVDQMEVALQAMAEGQWTTETELIEFLGIEQNELRRLANTLTPVVARLIRDEQGDTPEWFAADLQAALIDQRPAIASQGPTSSVRLGELVRAVEQVEEDADYIDGEPVNS